MNQAGERSSGARYAEPIASFYIPTTGTQTPDKGGMPLKQGDSFALLDPRGDIPRSESLSALGVYYNDTRHLSGLDFLIEGQRPVLLSASLQDDNTLFAVDLANQDMYREGKLAMSRETLHIVRTKFLWSGSFNERILVQNFGRWPATARLLIWFDADFRDLFEVRGIKRQRRGASVPTEAAEESVLFRYRGLDELERRTYLRFSPRPTALTADHAVFDLALAPHESVKIWMLVDFGSGEVSRKPRFGSRLRQAIREKRRIAGRGATISTSNTLLNEILCRAVADLHMLTTETEHGPYPYAGIPWFSTPFGRDGIITALELLWVDPSLGRGVLDFLAATQARTDDPARDAEPGKILHEMRQGEMARTGEVPFGKYYGSVDATPLFVLLAGLYHRRTGDTETIRRIWPQILAALSWIDGKGDPDHDGFVEYRTRTKKGLDNQGWKDSRDSIMHADGALASGPIALSEVQAYIHEAKGLAAQLARAIGEPDLAVRLEREALLLRESIEHAFWREELGTYALALDGEKQPCCVRASNAGHLLFGGVPTKARAETLASTLMHANSFSGWGIRTLSRGEARFNPMSYHNGSVWPHDNAVIALGLARYGIKAPVLSIFEALFDSVRYFEDGRLPELFCGFARRRGHAPTKYPVACAPQAWASGALISLLGALLGIEIDGAERELRFIKPVLPAEVEQIVLRRLTVGDGELDLKIERNGASVGVSVLSRTTDARVTVET